MAFEKKVGMSGPMKIVVKSATPAPDKQTGQQKVGKKVHEGVLAWYVTCQEPEIPGSITVYSPTQPAAGETYEGAWLEGNEWPAGSGTIYLSMFTASDKAKKDGSGGGRPGGAPPARDYTIENRQRAVDAVITHLQGKGDLHDICSRAAILAEFYKSGIVPPKKEPQA